MGAGEGEFSVYHGRDGTRYRMRIQDGSMGDLKVEKIKRYLGGMVGVRPTSIELRKDGRVLANTWKGRDFGLKPRTLLTMTLIDDDAGAGAKSGRDIASPSPREAPPAPASLSSGSAPSSSAESASASPRRVNPIVPELLARYDKVLSSPKRVAASPAAAIIKASPMPSRSGAREDGRDRGRPSAVHADSDTAADGDASPPASASPATPHRALDFGDEAESASGGGEPAGDEAVREYIARLKDERTRLSARNRESERLLELNQEFRAKLERENQAMKDELAKAHALLTTSGGSGKAGGVSGPGGVSSPARQTSHMMTTRDRHAAEADEAAAEHAAALQSMSTRAALAEKERARLDRENAELRAELETAGVAHERDMDALVLHVEQLEHEKEQLAVRVDHLTNLLSEADEQTRMAGINERAAVNAVEGLRHVIAEGGEAELANLVANSVHELERGRELADYLRGEMHRKDAILAGERAARRQLHNALEEMKGKVRVLVRIRPPRASADGGAVPSPPRSVRDDGTVAAVDDGTVEVTTTGLGAKHFKYYRVFQPETTQESVFDEVRPLVKSAVDGFNVSILAYGQTGAGKTHTITGTDAMPGVLPQSIGHLFSILNGHEHDRSAGLAADRGERTSTAYDYYVRCSLVELYLGQIHDLLADDDAGGQRKTHALRQDGNGRHFVQDLTMTPVSSAEDALAVLRTGLANRHVASTKLNDRSSRSHTLFTLHLEVRDNAHGGTSTVSKLSFLDLAGSERNTKSGSKGERFKEAQWINKSLSALGDVIGALSRHDQHVPYRNSKLTMLMQDALGGNAKALLFANVHPLHITETVGTLTFASKVKTVTNTAVRSFMRKQRK